MILQYNYRIEFLLLIAKVFLPPILLGSVILRFVPWTDSLVARLVWHSIILGVYWTAQVQYDVYAKKREATRRDAVLAPELKGRLPGNIDILFNGLTRHKLAYPFIHMNQKFEELQTDTVNIRILWQDIIFTRDHRVMQTVLATSFDDFAKGTRVKSILLGLFGNGIFNSDGEEAKAHRALTRPFFARERVRDFKHFERYADKVVDIFRNSALTRQSVDVQEVFGRFTLDCAGEFLFGTDQLNTLDLPLPVPGKAKLGPKGSLPEGKYGGFLRAFDEIQQRISERFRRRFLWPLFEFVTDSTTQLNKEIDEWVLPLVRRALEDKKKRGDAKLDGEEGSLTDHLADVSTDEKVIREELFNILLASRDTTSTCLTWLLYLFSQHPDVANKVRAEILNVIPEGAPTFEDLRNLKYLRACINETLRLFPPVGTDARASTRPTTIPSSNGSKPIYIPGPHTSLTYSIFLMHRRKDLWGPDAEDFVPERWIDPGRVKDITMDPFKFLPFNAGPRICLGQNFAYNEVGFLIVRILQVFDLFELRQQQDAPSGSHPPEAWKTGEGRQRIEKVWPSPAVTLYSRGGMWIKMSVARDPVREAHS